MKQFRVKSEEPKADLGGEAGRMLERAAELEQIQAEALTAPNQRYSLAESLSPITLDLARIDPHLNTLSEHHPFASEQYGKLVVMLISLASTRPLKRVLVTSAKQGEGRTSVLLNLAGALAGAKRRVLVVDTDLFQPSTLRLLGANVEAGLAEVVTCGLPMSDVTVRVLPFGFSLLPTRAHVENSVEVLDSSMFRAYLQLVEPHYDFVLFDSPPLLTNADAQILLRLVDGALLVIRPGTTTPVQMSKALRMFNKEDLIGVVLNRVARLEE